MEQQTQNTQEEDKKPFEPEVERVNEHNTGMAVVAYLLFFIPLLTDAKNDPFVKYHVKQGLTLFITAVLASIIGMIPILMVIGMLLHVGILVLAIIGILNAIHGKKEPLPIIGEYASKFTF